MNIKYVLLFLLALSTFNCHSMETVEIPWELISEQIEARGLNRQQRAFLNRIPQNLYRLNSLPEHIKYAYDEVSNETELIQMRDMWYWQGHNLTEQEISEVELSLFETRLEAILRKKALLRNNQNIKASFILTKNIEINDPSNPLKSMRLQDLNTNQCESYMYSAIPVLNLPSSKE